MAFLQSWGAYLTIFFPQIVSLTEKTLKNTNLVPSRHLKRVKDSLPFDMDYSNLTYLKFLIMKLEQKHEASADLG